MMDRVINTLIEHDLVCVCNAGIVLTGTIEECEDVGVTKDMLKDLAYV